MSRSPRCFFLATFFYLSLLRTFYISAFALLLYTTRGSIELFIFLLQLYEKIEGIKQLELDLMQTIQYKIPAPTVLDFLKNLLLEVLGIDHMGK